jgi:hypothetical protein
LDFNKLNIEEKPQQRFYTTRAPNHQNLDYAFKFHKAKIQSKEKDKGKMEEYLFDLENTWNLNIEMLSVMLENTPTLNQDQKKILLLHIQKIKELFLKKKNLRNEKLKSRGKVLMDKQILEEIKRRNEENSCYYQEQMDEIRENLEKKESFIKQFEKKFNEVEIYVQREAKTNQDLWERFMQFEIISFINRNESHQRKLIKIKDEMKQIQYDMNEILKENVELKKRDEYIDMSEDYDNQKSKYKSLIGLYNSKIKFLERNSEHLRNVLNSLNCKLNNYSLYNFDLKDKIKSGNTKEVVHKKINSCSAFSEFQKNNDIKLKFKEIRSINDNLDTKEQKFERRFTISDINEDNGENFQEDHNDSGQDSEERREMPDYRAQQLTSRRIFNDPENDLNKSNIEIENKNNSLIEEPSMLTKVQVPDFNKDIWDISCIENTEP